MPNCKRSPGLSALEAMKGFEHQASAGLTSIFIVKTIVYNGICRERAW